MAVGMKVLAVAPLAVDCLLVTGDNNTGQGASAEPLVSPDDDISEASTTSYGSEASGRATVGSISFIPSQEFLANLDMESLVSQFHDAIRKCDYAKSYYCILRGVDVDATDDKHKTALQILLESEGAPDEKIRSLLLDNGADPTIRDENGETKYRYWYPINNSSKADDEFWQKIHSSNEYLADSVLLFKTRHSVMLKRDADDIRQEFLHVMEEIERKGDWHMLFRRIHRTRNRGSTVLHWLVWYLPDSIDLIKRVVEIYERFGMPNMLWVEDDYRRTPPYIAARNGNLELVKIFISKCEYFGKLNVSFVRDPETCHDYPNGFALHQQFTIVFTAVERGHHDIADYVLKFFQDRDILRFLSLHYERFDESFVRYVLTKFQVEFVNGKHFGGLTALHLAALRVIDIRMCFRWIVIEELAKYFINQDKQSYINTPDAHGRTALDIILQGCVRVRKNVELLESFEGILTKQHQEELRRAQEDSDSAKRFARWLRKDYGFKSGIPTSSSEPQEAPSLTESKEFGDRVREISALVVKKGVYAVFGSQTSTSEDSCKSSIWGPQFAALVNKFNNGNTSNESADQSNVETQEDPSEYSDAGSMTTYLNTNMDTLDESVHHSNPDTSE